MENTSKALIIAGAVLLAILLITLGIMVFRNAGSVASDSTSLNEQEIALFNAKWTGYAGTDVSPNKLKEMIRAVNLSNSEETKNGTNRWIFVGFRQIDGIQFKNPFDPYDSYPDLKKQFSDVKFNEYNYIDRVLKRIVKLFYSKKGYVSGIQVTDP